MSATPLLSSSLEDYLEAIFHIIAEQEAVRAKDIAQRLKVSQPSVTGALRTLADKNYIHYEPYGVITLTPEGRKIAAFVAKRHSTLRSFLIQGLGIDEVEANEVACRMEHVISEHVMERFAALADYMAENKICLPPKTKKKPKVAKSK